MTNQSYHYTPNPTEQMYSCSDVTVCIYLLYWKLNMKSTEDDFNVYSMGAPD